MMEDKFDKRIRNKIKDLVENNEVPYNPEHWELLLAKRKKSKKRLVVLWRVAAVIVLLLIAGGVGNYFFEKSGDKEFSPQIISDDQNDSLRIDSIKKDPNRFITNALSDSLINDESGISVKDSTAIQRTNRLQNRLLEKTAIVSSENLKPTKNIAQVKTSEKIKEPDLNKELIARQNDLQKTDSAAIKERIAIQIDTVKDTVTVKAPLITDLENEPELKSTAKKPIRIGLNIAPIFNSSQDSRDSYIGYSGGISVEIPLTKKLDIYTGIMYSDQKLNIQQPAIFAGDEVSLKNTDVLTPEKAVLKGLEFPVNVKYNFSVDNKNVFVSAGFSSTTYFVEDIESSLIVNKRNETSYQNGFGNNIVQYELVQSKTTVVTSNPSSKFNFASILNVSVGMELPISNEGQSIIIEPYFKYLLNTVTQEQIDYSSAGVKLRYNFNFKRKEM